MCMTIRQPFPQGTSVCASLSTYQHHHVLWLQQHAYFPNESFYYPIKMLVKIMPSMCMFSKGIQFNDLFSRSIVETSKFPPALFRYLFCDMKLTITLLSQEIKIPTSSFSVVYVRHLANVLCSLYVLL